MKKIAVIGLGIVFFVLILLGVTFLESLKNRGVDDTATQPSPTPSANQRQIRDPLVEYDGASSDKLLEIVKSRPTPIEARDKNLRAILISELGNQSGVMQNTESYRLEYVKTPDSFEAEIKTTEITKAKNEVVAYLKSRGFTEDGICKLPLMFYLNFDTAKSVKNTGEEFGQIPDFCL